MQKSEQTRAAIMAHIRQYPQLQIADLFKFFYQSAFGCEHMISSPEAVLAYLAREAESLPAEASPAVDRLDGTYSRVHLGWLGAGLSVETLAKLFCLSAKAEERGREALEEKLAVAAQMAEEGILPVSLAEFSAAHTAWRAEGHPPVHHSQCFREAYHPAYRVIAEKYIPYLPLLAKLDSMLKAGGVKLAIEGGSASGKTTLAALLHEIYSCTVFHMDDFFLRPEQRTPERFAEPGGNVDRERFLAEVLLPMRRGEAVCYRPFSCADMSLAPPVTLTPTRLTVIEGAYSMHPDLAEDYDVSVFLDISPDLQRERIGKRNSPAMAERFFAEWIPLETRYFEAFAIPDRCDLRISVE